jgi:hypothetical protein
MRLRKKLGAVSAVVLIGVAAGTAIAVSQAAGAATGTAGATWAPPAPFPGFSASDAALQAITCPSLGNCVAVGYTFGATWTPIAATEANGVWGSTQVITGAGSLGDGTSADLTSVSCGGPGDCTATGTYHGTNGVATAYYVSETAGTWGAPAAVTGADQPAGTYSQVNGLSCGAVGYCTIAGRYTDQGVNNAGLTVSTPFTLDEANGAWGTPQPVPGLAALPSAGNLNTLDSVSCTGAGDCTASGESGGNGFIGRPFVVSETGGTWGSAGQLSQTLSTDDTMIACPDATGCAVAAVFLTANFAREIFTFDEANGAWGQQQQLSMPSSETDIVNNPLLSCRSAGNCVIVGNMDFQEQASLVTVPFAATEASSGTWGAAALLPGTPASADNGMAEALSCAPGGDCTIAGAAPGGTNTYVYSAVSSADGSIGTVRQVYQQGSSDTVAGLSCPQSGHCAMALELGNKNMLGTEATASAVALTASAPKVTYGAEQSETLTATASSAAGGTPTGTVTVTGPAGSTPCTIALANGTGTCTLTARQLPAGADTLTAAYGGDLTYVPASGTTTVTVSQAATATRLSFTPRSITFTGAATKLTATGAVSSTAGTPSGWTTVRVDGHAVPGCTNVWFSAGAVSCTGTTAILAGGTHNVTLSYSGRGNFAASGSPAMTLTVGAARGTPALSLSRSAVTYGSENAEKFTVSVSHVGSVRPTGKAQVRIGGSALCAVTLSNGAGSCMLTARQLRAGTYTIVAVYLGDVNYHSAQSAAKTLKVAA